MREGPPERKLLTSGTTPDARLLGESCDEPLAERDPDRRIPLSAGEEVQVVFDSADLALLPLRRDSGLVSVLARVNGSPGIPDDLYGPIAGILDWMVRLHETEGP